MQSGCKQVSLAASTLFLLAACGGSDNSTTLWKDSSQAPATRAQSLVSAMALEDKQEQLTGSNPGPVPEIPSCYGGRHVTGLPKYGIPTLRITNGPVGIGQNDCVSASAPNVFFDGSSAKATALPSAIAVAASFDPSVATAFGNVVGVEGNALALHVFEAPGMNLARLPVGGRNFEYMGEDPFLTGTMGVAEINAVQSHGMIAMAKHFVANEQETNRNNIMENIDDRTLHELYLLPFEMAVKEGNVAAVMCSYNSVNGYAMCENKHLLTDVLRGQWGFKGYVQSDFFAAYSTVPTMLAGLDHEMPTPVQWAPANINAALAAKTLQVSDIDTALTRRYTQMFKAGIFDRPLKVTQIDAPTNGAIARQIGEQAAVLLQNNGVLPLSKNVRNILVIGKTSQVYAQQAVAGGAAVGVAMGAGGGSSDVAALYTVAPVAGIKDVLTSLGNTQANVHLILVDDTNTTATIDGTPANFSDVTAAASNADAVIVMAGSMAEEGADQATFTDSTGINMESGKFLNTLDWYSPKAAKLATTAVVKNSGTLVMVKALTATNPNTVLVLKDSVSPSMDASLLSGGANAPGAILEAWFPGEEDGHIVGDLLFGVANPSGKLPVSLGITGQGFLESLTPDQYPGTLVGGKPTVNYTEKLNIGYRWYDAMGKAPAFPFGYGMSYTTFSLTGANLSSGPNGTYVVSVVVKNTGSVSGSEVAQVYLGLPSSSGEPPKRLVGFKKVTLAPGASQAVSVTIDPAAVNHPLSVWDTSSQQWTIPSGAYPVFVGNSSRALSSAGAINR
jgi:beta-glucosidase